MTSPEKPQEDVRFNRPQEIDDATLLRIRQIRPVASPSSRRRLADANNQQPATNNHLLHFRFPFKFHSTPTLYTYSYGRRAESGQTITPSGRV